MGRKRRDFVGLKQRPIIDILFLGGMGGVVGRCEREGVISIQGEWKGWLGDAGEEKGRLVSRVNRRGGWEMREKRRGELESRVNGRGGWGMGEERRSQ